MNLRSLPRLCAGLSLALALTGCANLQFWKKNQAPARSGISAPAEDLGSLRDQVHNVATQLERTLGNLSRLTNAGMTTEAFAAFSHDQKAFAKASDRLLTRSASVRNDGNAYFAAWSTYTAGIQDPEIRAVANQRRETLEKRYNAMLPPLVAARAELKTFVNDTADLSRALAYDQTQDGFAAAKALIQRTVTRGETTAESLKTLEAELNAIITLLPPAPAKR